MQTWLVSFIVRASDRIAVIRACAADEQLVCLTRCSILFVRAYYPHGVLLVRLCRTRDRKVHELISSDELHERLAPVDVCSIHWAPGHRFAIVVAGDREHLGEPQDPLNLRCRIKLVPGVVSLYEHSFAHFFLDGNISFQEEAA